MLRKCGAPENTPKTSRKCMKQSFTYFTSFHFRVFCTVTDGKMLIFFES